MSYEFSYDSDQFMLAFAIVDTSSPDFTDPYGRPLEEFFEIDAGLRLFNSG